MKPVDVFGIIVRTVGLIITLGIAWRMCVSITMLLGGSWADLMNLLFYIPLLLVSLWLLHGAHALVNFAYPGER